MGDVLFKCHCHITFRLSELLELLPKSPEGESGASRRKYLSCSFSPKRFSHTCRSVVTMSMARATCLVECRLRSVVRWSSTTTFGDTPSLWSASIAWLGTLATPPSSAGRACSTPKETVCIIWSNKSLAWRDTSPKSS